LQVPQASETQQVKLTQLPLPHSAPSPHDAPGCFRPQLIDMPTAAQKLPEVQSSFPSQDVRQEFVVGLQTWVPQDWVTRAGHEPVPLQEAETVSVAPAGHV